MRQRRGRLVGAALGAAAGLALASACVSSQGAISVAGNPDTLLVAPDMPELAANPSLRERLAADPHAYFRFISVPFARAACGAFRDVRGMPDVSLHGDAHLEQYVVTDAGRGISDFDDESVGPAVLDLVRFGVSVQLACRTKGWPDHADEAFSAFLDGYREGLTGTDTPIDPPFVARRLEATFAPDRAGFLAWADKSAPELPRAKRERVEQAFAAYAKAIRRAIPGLDESFFTIKRIGASTLGVGSARDEKYVLRIEGVSPALEDDVVLEAKEVTDLAAVECVRGARKANPFRALIGPARNPYVPYLGFLRLGDRTFWVHAWIANYRELSIERDLDTPEELDQVAHESGIQLAKVHLQPQAAPDPELAGAELKSLDSLEPRLRAAVRVFTAATLTAWGRFAQSVSAPEPETP